MRFDKSKKEFYEKKDFFLMKKDRGNCKNIAR